MMVGFDEVVEGKAGNSSHLLGWFWSSLQSKSIKSVKFLCTGLIDAGTHICYILGCEQVVGNLTKDKDKDKDKTIAKKSPGRPKGSKNKVKASPEPVVENTTASFVAFKSLLERLIVTFATYLPTLNLKKVYLVTDDAYATSDYIALITANGFHFISKWKNNGNFYLPALPAQPQEGKKKVGRAAKYGKK